MSITERLLNKLAGLPAPRRPKKEPAAQGEREAPATNARLERIEAERYAGAGGQACGGGRRVIRKKIGD